MVRISAQPWQPIIDYNDKENTVTYGGLGFMMEGEGCHTLIGTGIKEFIYGVSRISAYLEDLDVGIVEVSIQLLLTTKIFIIWANVFNK